MVTSIRDRHGTLGRIDAVHATVRALPPDGPIRSVLTDPYLDECREWVRQDPDLENALWPPLLVWAMMPWHSPEQITLLDSDVRRIRDHPTSDPKAAVRWLESKPVEGRAWRAGLFESTVKARALAFSDTHPDWEVGFDAPLPSGRNADVLLRSAERSYYLECTVITESDEDQEVHAAWMEARKAEPDLLLGRPGRFDPPGAKGPSPYYDANRFYIKVFDKLQRGGDPAKTQTSAGSPNLLLLSCFPAFGSPLPFSPALGWALDELFCGQPNMGSIKTMPQHSPVTDISLLTFLRREWPATALDLAQCPRRLSGALLFNCLGLQEGRVNYNADSPHRLTQLEMASLEAVFLPPRGWEQLQARATPSSS